MDLESHGIVALIRNEADKFLLLEEKRSLMHGQYAPPHGRCERSDKSEKDAVVREVKEETNLDVYPLLKLLTQPADTKVKTVSFWSTELLSNEIMVDAKEVASYGWFSIDEALRLKLYPGTRIFFELLRDGKISLDS